MKKLIGRFLDWMIRDEDESLRSIERADIRLDEVIQQWNSFRYDLWAIWGKPQTIYPGEKISDNRIFRFCVQGPFFTLVILPAYALGFVLSFSGYYIWLNSRREKG